MCLSLALLASCSPAPDAGLAGSSITAAPGWSEATRTVGLSVRVGRDGVAGSFPISKTPGGLYTTDVRIPRLADRTRFERIPSLVDTGGEVMLALVGSGQGLVNLIPSDEFEPRQRTPLSSRPRAMRAGWTESMIVGNIEASPAIVYMNDTGWPSNLAILGRDFFSAFEAVRFDWSERRVDAYLAIDPAIAATRAEQGDWAEWPIASAVAGAAGLSSRRTLEVRLNGETIHAVIDTGFAGGLLLPSVPGDCQFVRTGTAYGFSGASATHHVYRLNRPAFIGDRAFHGVEVSVLSGDQIAAREFPLIGLQILERQSVLLDQKNGRVWLGPPAPLAVDPASIAPEQAESGMIESGRSKPIAPAAGR